VKVTRQQILFVVGGALVFLAGLVAGGVWDPTDQLLSAAPLALFGAAAFVWAHA
jgi:hypothetical protein